jgi:malate dehydrogenase
MWGQHGDHLVPIWSGIHARGVSEQHFADVVGTAREGRSLADLPDEIPAARTRMLNLVNSGDVPGAYDFIQTQPADIRAAIKPFFTHFTAGRTTELATAHSVVDLVAFIVGGHRRVVPAQVILDGEVWKTRGPVAVPVMLDPNGWDQVVPVEIAEDEQAALAAAAAAINSSLDL